MTQSITTFATFDKDAALDAIRNSSKSEVTRMRYANTIKRAYANNVNFSDAHSLTLFADSLPISTRKQFLSALTIVFEEIQTTIDENATIETNAQAQVFERRLNALKKRVADSVKSDSISGVRTHSWLSTEEIQKLKSATIADTNKAMRDSACLALLFGLGMRREEAASARWCDIVKVGETFAINILGKGKKLRSVPIPHSVLGVLNAWKSRTKPSSDLTILCQVSRVDNALITKKITGKTVFRIVENLSNVTGIDCEPHDLRRSFAQTLRDNAVALETISKLLGHASVQTTMTYLNVNTLDADVSAIVL